MFANLFFIILVMILISMTPEIAQQDVFKHPLSPEMAFIAGLASYALVLLLICLQNRFFPKHFFTKSRLLALINVELLLFLFFYHVVLNAPRLLEFAQSDTLVAVFSLLLYFGGLTVFYSTSKEKSSSNLEIRLLIPFCLPFVFITLLLDLLKLLPHSIRAWILDSNSWTASLMTLGIILIGLLALMILLPFLIQKIWLCQPLKDSEIQQRLENLCERAHFKHAGLKTWTVLNHSLTAAIVGIVPQFRYILFTNRLVDEFSPHSVEAILAHEIGHSYHKHLLFLPLVIFGLSLFLGILFPPFSYGIDHLLQKGNEFYPSEFWLFFHPLAIFVLYAVMIALYLRVLFGLFSRLFERQADLHVFHLEVPAQHMIEALNHIGQATGNSHRVPNWHHYSIQQRIDFLEAAEQNPALIVQHHRKVKFYKASYLILLSAGVGLFFWLF